MADTADVVVIGAGVIGCSIGYELAREGYSVMVLDQGPAAGHGSTSASSAIVRFNYSTYAGVAVAWEGLGIWTDWREHLQGDDDGSLARFVQTGALCLDSPDIDPPKILAHFDTVGIPYQIWDADTIRQRIPQLDPARFYPPKPVDSDEFFDDPDGELGGFWTPDAGFIDDPTFATHNLMVAAQRLGAGFRFRTAVAGIRTAGGRVTGVDLADGSHVDAPVVVNAAGPFSSRLNALAGVLDDFTISTRPLRVEVHQFTAPPGYGAGLVPQADPDALPIGPLLADLDTGHYSRGTLTGEIIVGGVEPACDPMHWVDDPDQVSPALSQQVYRAQSYRAARRMPDLTVPNTPRGIVGVYDVTDDWIPIYDRTALPGFYVAIGTSGNQFKNAPLVGVFLTEIITACENGRDHDVTPVTVTLPRTGNRVDLSTYRRTRPITASSSFTVMG